MLSFSRLSVPVGNLLPCIDLPPFPLPSWARSSLRRPLSRGSEFNASLQRALCFFLFLSRRLYCAVRAPSPRASPAKRRAPLLFLSAREEPRLALPSTLIFLEIVFNPPLFLRVSSPSRDRTWPDPSETIPLFFSWSGCSPPSSLPKLLFIYSPA